MEPENIDLISELVRTIKEVSPLVWEAAVDKNQALFYTGFLWVIFYVLAVSVLAKFFKFASSKAQEPSEGILDDKSGWFVLAAICFLATAFCVVSIMFTLIDLLQRFLAPEYYTIQILMELIP